MTAHGGRGNDHVQSQWRDKWFDRGADGQYGDAGGEHDVPVGVGQGAVHPLERRATGVIYHALMK